MKYPYILILFCFAFSLASCSDEDIDRIDYRNQYKEGHSQEGMQRAVFASVDELHQTISRIDTNHPHSRGIILQPQLRYSEDGQKFVSLLNRDFQRTMSSLTPTQLDSIKNDEDDLEFTPSDSVIADIRFAQLLNADREIQVADTIYKYVPQGVAFTHKNNRKSLIDIEKFIDNNQQLKEGERTILANNVQFISIKYVQTKYLEKIEEPTTTNQHLVEKSSSPTDLRLDNGVVIPVSDIRDVNYKDKGDGNWFHRLWNGIWGKNIVAIKKFSKRRKLTMNFYDQNYIVYANIGTELKMQKKVCGIWWNIKAEEMVQGWDMIGLKYTFKQPVINLFNNPTSKRISYPQFMWNPFPAGKEAELLFTIPFLKFNFTTNDLNRAFQASVKYAMKTATNKVKQLIYNNPKKAGVMSYNDRAIYIYTGPYSYHVYNKRSTEKRFYSQWLPGDYQFGFTIGRGIQMKGVSVKNNNGTSLHRGIVYGAIKYKGKWLAARITKSN